MFLRYSLAVKSFALLLNVRMCAAVSYFKYIYSLPSLSLYIYGYSATCVSSIGMKNTLATFEPLVASDDDARA